MFLLLRLLLLDCIQTARLQNTENTPCCKAMRLPQQVGCAARACKADPSGEKRMDVHRTTILSCSGASSMIPELRCCETARALVSNPEDDLVEALVVS